eukprot:scaffold32642_cov69-Phaeocystis_antarctica.AAC.1
MARNFLTKEGMSGRATTKFTAMGAHARYVATATGTAPPQPTPDTHKVLVATPCCNGHRPVRERRLTDRRGAEPARGPRPALRLEWPRGSPQRCGRPRRAAAHPTRGRTPG